MSSIITKRILLSFYGALAGKPVVSDLIRKYELEINIYRASITPNEEGYMAIDIKGDSEKIEEALKFLNSLNVDIKQSETSLIWNEDRCVSCGNCLSHCPTNALYIADESTRKVTFNGDKCIECLSCIKNCPFNACTTLF